ncbi:MAG TPA: Hpt domain-containing protein, partial [Gemmatirosa sp.]|nr:Hpt domain-containing protein [Gemmatirosa sp.]
MNARYATLFAAEAREQLAAVTAGVLALESASAEGPPSRAADAGAADVRTAVDAVFRAVHTVKGMSATMGYAAVEHVAHAVESLLARVRSGEAVATAALVEALLDGADALDAAVEAAVQGTVAPDVARVVAVLEAAAEASTVLPDDGSVDVTH